MVEARTALGASTFPVSWAFVIDSPWYRTAWAYALYLAIGVAVIWVIVRLRLASVRRENLRLEQIVSERTSELRENETALRSARDEADRANRAKSQFLANMSHELRTPLNGVLGYAQVMARDPEMSSKNRGRVAVVESSGKHLLKLINEVLDLSKIEAGRMEVKLSPVSLEGLIRTAKGVFEHRIDEKGLDYSLTLGAVLPKFVFLDEQKVGQVLFNLLGNAVKFTERGRIELRVESGALGETLRFEVCDTGPGISDEAKSLIFEPFKQLDNQSTSEAGTGLGLAISSKLVVAMGGRIGLESEVGEGSVFWFELPLQEAGPEVNKGIASSKSKRFVEQGFRILVVDDVPVNRDIVEEMLVPLGFVVEQAGGGQDALEMIQSRRPDLVLLDMRMEPMDGAEVVKQIRKLEEGKELPVLAFSASAIGFTVERARAIGCDDFISKPFEWDEMLDKIRGLLNLTWDTEGDDEEEPPATEEAALSQEDLKALKKLARRGEPAALKEHLEAIGQREPELEALVSELGQLVARFRIRELGERLEEMEPRP